MFARSMPSATAIRQGGHVSYLLNTVLVHKTKQNRKEHPPAATEAERVPQIEGTRLYKLLIR